MTILCAGQALCSHCRENTHRAKMFASHEIMHMSKCIREPRRVSCLYLVWSPLLKFVRTQSGRIVWQWVTQLKV